MVTGLLAEQGLRVVDHSSRGDHDELILDVMPGWRSREGRVRILYRSARQQDLDDLTALAGQAGLSEAVLIEVAEEAASGLRASSAVEVVATDELVARLEDSAVIQWDGAQPSIDREALRGLREVDACPPTLDVLGIRALPLLARNKLPPEFAAMGAPPDELFERLSFRILTHVFRFSGRDLGASARAERLPDALLESPADAAEPFSAVLDCKASRDGFVMDADDETRLCGYIDHERDNLVRPDEPYIIVISSAFPGRADRYTRRRTAIADRCGAKLVYLHVEYLVSDAVKLEAGGMDPGQREVLPWKSYLDEGRPTTDLVSYSENVGD